MVNKWSKYLTKAQLRKSSVYAQMFARLLKEKLRIDLIIYYPTKIKIKNCLLCLPPMVPLLHSSAPSLCIEKPGYNSLSLLPINLKTINTLCMATKLLTVYPLLVSVKHRLQTTEEKLMLDIPRGIQSMKLIINHIQYQSIAIDIN